MPAYMRIDVKRLPACDVAGELFFGDGGRGGEGRMELKTKIMVIRRFCRFFRSNSLNLDQKTWI